MLVIIVPLTYQTLAEWFLKLLGTDVYVIYNVRSVIITNVCFNIISTLKAFWKHLKRSLHRKCKYILQNLHWKYSKVCWFHLGTLTFSSGNLTSVHDLVLTDKHSLQKISFRCLRGIQSVKWDDSLMVLHCKEGTWMNILMNVRVFEFCYIYCL